MYGETVCVEYMGVRFEVFVCCLPKTPRKILQEMAIKILEDALDKNGITILN